jgi:hypothetical protein
VVSIPAGALVASVMAFGPAAAQIAQLAVSLAIGAGVGLFMIYSSILDEEFGTLSVRLVPRNPGAGAQMTQPASATAVPATQ